MISEIIDLPRRGLSLVLLLLLTLSVSLSPVDDTKSELSDKVGDEEQIIENSIISEEQQIIKPIATPIILETPAAPLILDSAPEIILPTKSPEPITTEPPKAIVTPTSTSTPKVEIFEIEIKTSQDIEIIEITEDETPLAEHPGLVTIAVERDYPLYEIYKDGYQVKVPTTTQWYLRDVSLEYNLPEKFLYGMILAESTFDINAKNGSCKGLFQIDQYWLSSSRPLERIAPLDGRNLFDPIDNITTMVEMMNYAVDSYNLDLTKQSDLIKLGYWWNTGSNPKNITSWTYSTRCIKFGNELIPYEKEEINTETEG